MRDYFATGATGLTGATGATGCAALTVGATWAGAGALIAGAFAAGATTAGAFGQVLEQAEIPTATAIAANTTMNFFIDPP
jgi:hypothetical protein